MAAAETLAARIERGDRTALARLISWAENADPRFAAELAALWPKVGRAWRIGVTGPPGAGKSTLVNELARVERTHERTVGICAVDPSSPFTGGALLGDRIRMDDRTLDPGVYIRSMASRGSHGGLARAAASACDVLDAFGFGTILLETVGVGQAEYDVLDAADTVVVVLCPGAGDGIQAMKAGLLEVADVLVVNKSDLPGAERLMNDLTDAASGLGAARTKKRVEQVRHSVSEQLAERLWGPEGLRGRVESELARGVSPHAIAAALLEEITHGLTRPAEVRG
ncbi:MAG: methylmalonyl Co-A mutase-associated GTPase MeaB [Planctomycetota bacterium]|nr:methylmalonyl Co-A mutase-associated GTPase MeaB [Planctomycetota bacterium]